MKRIVSLTLSLVISASLLFAVPVYATEEYTEPTETVNSEEVLASDAGLFVDENIVTVEEIGDENSEEETATEATVSEAAIEEATEGETEESEKATEVTTADLENVGNGNETVAEVFSEEIETESEAADEEAAYKDIAEETTEEETKEEETAAKEEPVYEPTEVIVAYSVEEAAGLTQAADTPNYFTVDAATGDVDGRDSFEDLGESYDEVVEPAETNAEKTDMVVEFLEESPLYIVEDVNDTEVEAVSIYGNQRLVLEADLQDTVDAYGATKAVYCDGYYTLEYDSEEDTKNAYEKLVKDYGADMLLRDLPVRTMSDSAWGGAYIKTQNALSNSEYTSSPVTVAVVDTGINASHEVFAGKTISGGYDFVNKTDRPGDNEGHGTAVAGVIAQNTGDNVEIMPVKVLNSSNDGSLEDMLKGAEYADQNGADVINISLGAVLMDLEEDYTEADAISDHAIITSRLGSLDATIIAASGNQGIDQKVNLCVPASIDSVISVGAISNNKTRGGFSNFGENLDFVAPGVGIYCAFSPANNFGWISKNGTSFASPYIASVAALIKAKNPEYTNDEIYYELLTMCEDLGDPGYDIYYGNGCPVFTAEGEADIPALVKQIILGKSELALKPGDTHKISAKVYPENATDNSIEFSSSDTAVATVDENGGVTAVKPGTATITVSAKDGSGVTASCGVVVTAIDINDCKIDLSGTSFVYTGSAIEPTVTVSYDGRELTPGTDYKLQYENNINAGTATVTISGVGVCEGSVQKSFTINKKSVSGLEATGFSSEYTYNGNAIAPAVTVKYNGNTLVKGKDYTVAYSNNTNAGVAYIKITGLGNYTGDLTKSFNIIIGTGLYKVDGVWRYYENGVFKKVTGVVQRISDGQWMFVSNGVFKASTGVAKRLTDGAWVFVKNGVFTKATGVAKRGADNKWMYVENGIFKKVTGLAFRGADKKWVYVKDGFFSESTGVVQRISDGQWMFVSNGVFKASTGVAKRLTDGAWVFVKNGVFTKATGVAKRGADNKWMYVENGIFKKVTGLAFRGADKKWVYVQNGFLTKSTGIAQRVSDGKWMYVENGAFKTATGLAKRVISNGYYYYVKDGYYQRINGKAKIINSTSSKLYTFNLGRYIP